MISKGISTILPTPTTLNKDLSPQIGVETDFIKTTKSSPDDDVVANSAVENSATVSDCSVATISKGHSTNLINGNWKTTTTTKRKRGRPNKNSAVTTSQPIITATPATTSTVKRGHAVAEVFETIVAKPTTDELAKTTPDTSAETRLSANNPHRTRSKKVRGDAVAALSTPADLQRPTASATGDGRNGTEESARIKSAKAPRTLNAKVENNRNTPRKSMPSDSQRFTLTASNVRVGEHTKVSVQVPLTEADSPSENTKNMIFNIIKSRNRDNEIDNSNLKQPVRAEIVHLKNIKQKVHLKCISY